MSEMFNPHAPATAYDHNTTIVAVLELSGKNWLFGAVAPGLSRRTRRSLEARNVEAVVRALAQAKGESAKARFEVARIVVGFESGRDGFWIARALQQRGIEVYVMHAASIAVERRGKRAKTDRLDVDLLLTTLMGWLRGEPGRCTMAPIPSEEEEDLREAGRRRETLVHARLKVENQIASLLIRHGIEGFKPRLKNAETRLCELRTFDGRSLPTNTMNSLRLLLAQHRLLSGQLKEIEETTAGRECRQAGSPATDDPGAGAFGRGRRGDGGGGFHGVDRLGRWLHAGRRHGGFRRQRQLPR